MRTLVVAHMRGADAQAVPIANRALAVDAALESIERISTRLTQVVECRYFAAMGEEETALALGIDVTQVSRDWRRARAWLLREAAGTDGSAPAAVANATWVDAVFEDALAIPVDRLDGFLNRCSDAPGGLRAHVEELLTLCGDASARLSPGDLTPDMLWSILRGAESAPPEFGDFAETAAAAEPEIEPAGWRIVRELQRGRLGPLYLAERAGTRGERKGVLRYVPRSAAADLAALRSRPDYRALSALRHDGIARLLDAGEADDGRLFIVWQYVEGRPIDRYCDEEQLSIDARLELFSRICAAVQYAHRQLAVHAAIEPSTVVVTSGGHVTLLDFGSAGLVLPAGEAADAPFDARPSPEFASPEQVRGDPLAVASDVYQLGLLLYLLMTGEQAQTVTGRTRAALEHAVCRTAPVLPSARAATVAGKNAAARRLRPRSFARALRGDLDAILMYALRKQPERRYPSVSLLRSDVERYRQRRPIWAQRDTPWYRLRKFAARCRAPIAAAVVLAVLGAAIMPARLAERVRSSRETARTAEAEQLLDRMFASAETQAGAEVPDALQYVEQAVTIARTELAGESKSQGRLFTAIGRAYASLGHYQRSIDILEEALALRRVAYGSDSLEVADTLQALGEARQRFGRYDEAETSFRTALAVRTVREGTRTPGALAASTGLSEVLHARGQFDAAEKVIREAIAVLRPELIDAPDDAPVDDLLPRGLQALANVLRDRGVLGESAALYDEAISTLRRRGAERASQVAVVQVDLARLLILRSELDRAEFELAQALATFRGTRGGQHPALGAALREQALLRLEQGRFDEAQVLLGEAERLQDQLFGRVNPSVPRIRAVQAELARRRGDVPQAVVVATEALEELGRLNMPDHPSTVDIRSTLAQSLMARGEFHQATRVLGQALSVAERAFVSYDPRISRLQSALRRAAGARSVATMGTAPDSPW